MKARTVAGAAWIAMVLLLGGCASAVPSVPVSPSTTVTQVPTPTAIDSATPDPPQNPADPSPWILGFDRVAAVRAGQSLAALASAADLVPVEDTVDSPPGYWTDPAAPPAAINTSVMQ